MNEQRLFAARAAVAAPPPPFEQVLARARRTAPGRLARAASAFVCFASPRRLSLLAVAAAFGIAAAAWPSRGPVAPIIAAEPIPSFACYDDPRSLDAEANAYATDRAIASAEERFAACLVGTPALACGTP